MKHIRSYFLIATTFLTMTTYLQCMEEVDEKKPQENSGIVHWGSKLLFPRSYVCDPENNQRYRDYKQKIADTSVEKLRTDAKFWDDYKRMTERLVKLLGVVETAIVAKDIDTLTLLNTYNDELPDPLELVRKALDEAQVKINRSLKKEEPGK